MFQQLLKPKTWITQLLGVREWLRCLALVYRNYADSRQASAVHSGTKGVVAERGAGVPGCRGAPGELRGKGWRSSFQFRTAIT